MTHTNKIITTNKSRYRILDKIGQGGVGAVYKGLNINNGAHVAIKALHGERLGINDTTRERFKQEIEISCNTRYNYLVRGLDHDSSYEFLVLEWIPGGTLSDKIPQANKTKEMAIEQISDLLCGFNELRANNIVHRDIKSNNILIDSDGRLRIADLGIAKTPTSPNLTTPQDLMGSLLYISPLQRRSPEAAGPGDDFYSLCCIMKEVATNERLQAHSLPLAVRDELLIPREVARMIDKGIDQSIPWEDVHAELREMINITKGRINKKYTGSMRSPGLVAQKKIQELLSDISQFKLSSKTSRHDGVERRDYALTLRVARIIKSGFESAASEVREHGLDLKCDIRDDNQWATVSVIAHCAVVDELARTLNGFPGDPGELENAYMRFSISPGLQSKTVTFSRPIVIGFSEAETLELDDLFSDASTPHSTGGAFALATDSDISRIAKAGREIALHMTHLATYRLRELIIHYGN